MNSYNHPGFCAKWNLYSSKNAWIPVSVFILLLAYSCGDEVTVKPKFETVETSETDITSTTAKLKGEFITIGNMNIIEYGIELSESVYFTTPVSKTISGVPVVGFFEVEFTGLKPNTLYYYKAYVLVNTARIYPQGYLQFTTKP